MSLFRKIVNSCVVEPLMDSAIVLVSSMLFLVLMLIFFFEMGSHYVVLTVLEFDM